MGTISSLQSSSSEKLSQQDQLIIKGTLFLEDVAVDFFYVIFQCCEHLLHCIEVEAEIK